MLVINAVWKSCVIVMLRVAVILCLVHLVSTARAGALLYVVIENNSIVSFDISKGTAAEVEASMKTVISTNINGPYGMVLDRHRNLYVANFFGNSISKFGPRGNYIGSITESLNGPLGLTIDASGDIYAANFHASTISRFSANGVLKSQITTGLSGPVNLAFDSAGGLYACNPAGYAITKYDAEGNLIGSIPAFTPEGIGFDRDGNIYAALRDRNRVRKMDPFGNFIKVIGLDQVSAPSSIVFDAEGNFYVSSRGEPKVSKYDTEGNLLMSWNTTFNAYGMMYNPGLYPVPEPTSIATMSLIVGFGLLRMRRQMKTNGMRIGRDDAVSREMHFR